VTSRSRLAFIIGVAFLIVAFSAGAWLLRYGPEGPDRAGPQMVRSDSRLPRLDGAEGWINGHPLTPDSLQGHPTVLMLWSDTDPASLESLPWAESWYRAYAPFGVRVIGVHLPDYAFASDSAVAGRAVRRLSRHFPIALDPHYQILSAFGRDEERPAVIVADTEGRIVLNAGRDSLAAASRIIRDLVREVRPDAGFPAMADPSGDDAAPSVATRFAFLGTARVKSGPLATAEPGRAQTFTAQFRFQEEGEPYVPYPVGRWKPSAEGLSAARGGAANYVAIRYPGGSVAAVIAPPFGQSSRVWILADDAWLSPDEYGEDIETDPRGASYIDVKEPRLYRIARGAKPHVLKLSPEDPGVTVYSFAFEAAEETAESARNP